MCAIKRPLKRHVQRELFNETPRTETIIKYTNIQIKYETKKKKEINLGYIDSTHTRKISFAKYFTTTHRSHVQPNRKSSSFLFHL